MSLHGEKTIRIPAAILAVLLLSGSLLCACAKQSTVGQDTSDDVTVGEVTDIFETGDGTETRAPETTLPPMNSDDSNGNGDNGDNGDTDTEAPKLENIGEQSDAVNEYDW